MIQRQVTRATWVALCRVVMAHRFGFTECEIVGSAAQVPARKLELVPIKATFT